MSVCFRFLGRKNRFNFILTDPRPWQHLQTRMLDYRRKLFLGVTRIKTVFADNLLMA